MSSFRNLALRPGLLTAVALTLAAGVSHARAADAMTTPGSGDLTICRSWIVYQSCNTYHKIELPPRIAIGDDVAVTFGSNNKDYLFHVIRIQREGDGCRFLSNASGAEGDGERIEVATCKPTDKSAETH